ncbi:hypothetical protein VNO80_14992 [Phaseolus coccineus]|uniref:Uncharacterized protein n=1 Tax=Phaseolus coccineus TaxID=3886 RepID=A0AAN9MPF7_PHACN
MFPLLSLKSSVKHNRMHDAPHRDTSAAVMALLTESQLPLFLKIGEKLESKDCANTSAAVMTLLTESQSPIFVKSGERSWKGRTGPVGKRLAKWAVF